LRDRFDQDLDVDLYADYWDPNAVASLFKAYVRECRLLASDRRILFMRNLTIWTEQTKYLTDETKYLTDETKYYCENIILTRDICIGPGCILTDQGLTAFQDIFTAYNDMDLYIPDSITLDAVHPLINNAPLLQSLQNLIQTLPTENRDFLALFFAHLRRIRENEAVNKMGLSNLQVVWSPTIRFGGKSWFLILLLLPNTEPTVTVAEY